MVRIWAKVSVVFQLLEREELNPAASAGGQDLGKDFCRVPAAGTRGARSSCQHWWSRFGHGFLSCSSCWNTRSSIQLPALVVRIWAGISIVFQLLEHEEPDSAASADGQDLGKGFCRVPAAGTRGAQSSCQRWWSGFGQGFLSCSSCWNTRSSIQLPALVVRIWARISVVFQLLEHEELDPAASAGGQDLGKDFCRVPAAGTRGARSSCPCWWSGFGQGFLSCSSCWNTRSSIQLP